MREDFNKQLTERERIGHKRKFGDIRNAKANKVLDEDMSGGKESIHTRRRHAKGSAGGRKSFNENLNPLRSFLATNAGRPWNKVYSEITTAFDKRKVINNHILEHLFQYVELEVYIIDGKPHTMSKWRSASKEFYPIISGGRMPSYYVDPRDGLLKAAKRGKTKRIKAAEDAAAYEKRLAKLYHRIDDDNHLIREDGTWWHYQAKAKPPLVAEYHMPENFALLYPDAGGPYALSTVWRNLPQEEKERIGKKEMVEEKPRDALGVPDIPGFYRPGGWYRTGPRIIPDSKYFFSRQQASHKQLKAAGVDGMLPDGEVKTMSHREASKYRPKKAGK